MANVYPNNRLVIDKEKKFSNRRKYSNAISLTESWNRTISFPPFCMREKETKIDPLTHVSRTNNLSRTCFQNSPAVQNSAVQTAPFFDIGQDERVTTRARPRINSSFEANEARVGLEKLCNNVVRRCNNALKIASLRFVWRYDTRERKKRSRSAEIGYRRVGRVEDSLFRRVKRFVISSFADWIE